MKTVLDLFSGIGGFSLAARRAGFSVVAHCEIDQFPKAVLTHRFFNTPIFDDIRTLNKKTFYEKTRLKKIDIVCGGSPCQDFSVAGRQRGFDGDRSSLFLEQMRVGRELGAEYIVWENVPGVLSSNGGKDFARILSEFSGWTIEPQKFGGVGCVRARGDRDFGVFYRIFDSRFFGVPQRRRRIYLVARLGGLCRPEVLFESDSLRGHSASGAAQGQDVAAFANTGIHGVADGFGVRRLTPRECERLQGFPDDWTLVPYRGKPAESCPDGPRYKACGNAVTVNVAQWVLERLARYA